MVERRLLTYFGVINVSEICDNEQCKITTIEIVNNLLDIDVRCQLRQPVEAFCYTHNYAHFLIQHVSNGDDGVDVEEDHARVLSVRHDGIRCMLVDVNFTRVTLNILPIEHCNMFTIHVQRQSIRVNNDSVRELAHLQTFHANILVDFMAYTNCEQRVSPTVLLCSTSTSAYLCHNSATLKRPQLFRIFTESEPVQRLLQISFDVQDDVLTSMTAGYDHVLLLTAGGCVYSFGTGSRGELGQCSIGDGKSPVQLDALRGVHVREIACGAWHSAAIDQTGEVYLWGWNRVGQLGNSCTFGSISDTPAFHKRHVNTEFRHVTAYRNCTILGDQYGDVHVLGQVGHVQ